MIHLTRFPLMSCKVVVYRERRQRGSRNACCSMHIRYLRSKHTKWSETRAAALKLEADVRELRDLLRYAGLGE